MSAPTPRTNTGDSSAGLAFSLYAPTPLSEAWKLVSSPQGAPQDQLTWRFAFVEQALWLLVAVLDGERLRLGLEAPRKMADFLGRLNKPTLGGLFELAQLLAREVGRSPQTALDGLARVVGPEGGPGAFGEALLALIATRNDIMHDVHGRAPDHEAHRLLAESSAHLRALILGLDALKLTPLIVVEKVTDRLDGSAEVRVLVFQGPSPRLEHVTDRPGIPTGMPLLLTSEGRTVPLAPWVMFSDFGQSSPAHLRPMARWEKQGPVYSRAGIVEAAPHPAFSAAPPPSAAALFESRRPPSPEPHPGLATLWRRIVEPSERGDTPTIPGYTVERLLGRGASGSVWRARDPAGRAVALKVLHPALAESPNQRARLEREYKLLQRVRHPGVARVHELLAHSPVGPVLVMEAVDGRPLSELVAATPLDPTTAAGVCAKVLSALGDIHSLGLVHRDVKPANILMDATNEPRLVDFGVARARDLSQITGAVDVVGTQAYAAPEQLLGGTDVDGRADLFAVGRMLPVLCSQEGDWNHRLGRLPGALQCIVRRATQPDPAHRYPSAVVMQRELQARQVAGWDGPPVGVGDLLPGGLRLIEQLDEVLEKLWLFLAVPVAGGDKLAVLVAGGPTGWTELAQRLDRASPELRRMAGCGGLRLTEDGLAFAELRGDEPLVWAKRLLSVPEKREWSNTETVAAALGGAAVVAGGLLSAVGLGMTLNGLAKSLKRATGTSPPANPPPASSSAAPAVTVGPPLSRATLLRDAQGAALMLHALARATGETTLNEALWVRLQENELRAPLRVLGDEGDGWCGPIGQILVRLEGRRSLLASVAGLSVPLPSAAALKQAERAVIGLNAVLDRALATLPTLDPRPYARRTDGGWEILAIHKGKGAWLRIR